MEDSAFWAIIDEARGGSDRKLPSANANALLRVLKTKPADEVQAFALKFNDQICDLNRWELWAVGYLMNGGMGDDSFHYFRSWIVGKGEECTKAALANPDSVSDFVEEGAYLDNEMLEYVAIELCTDAGREDPRELTERFPDDDPTGEPFDEEEDLEKKYPKSAHVARMLGN